MGAKTPHITGGTSFTFTDIGVGNTLAIFTTLQRHCFVADIFGKSAFIIIFSTIINRKVNWITHFLIAAAPEKNLTGLGRQRRNCFGFIIAFNSETGCRHPPGRGSGSGSFGGGEIYSGRWSYHNLRHTIINTFNKIGSKRSTINTHVINQAIKSVSGMTDV